MKRTQERRPILLTVTSYDSLENLRKMYKPFIDHNLKKLKDNHAQIFCEIDATKLSTEDVRKKLDPDNKKFDRIVWNFPHAGFPEE